MALFNKKTWKNRKSEFPNRRRLTKEDGSSELVTVSREEGIISEEGEAYSAENMNDLEDRVEKGFNNLSGAASSQMITSYSDLMANTASGYLPDAKAVKEGFDTVNSNLTTPQAVSLTSYNQSNYSISNLEVKKVGSIAFVSFYVTVKEESTTWVYINIGLPKPVMTVNHWTVVPFALSTLESYVPLGVNIVPHASSNGGGLQLACGQPNIQYRVSLSYLCE